LLKATITTSGKGWVPTSPSVKASRCDVLPLGSQRSERLSYRRSEFLGRTSPPHAAASLVASGNCSFPDSNEGISTSTKSAPRTATATKRLTPTVSSTKSARTTAPWWPA
jgi:hypothetical protein